MAPCAPSAQPHGAVQTPYRKDPALTRRFQVLQVAEPEEVAAVEMVRGLVTTLEKHHDVLILDEAVRAAVQLSHRYIPARQLPDKAISLLDTAAARVALSLHTPPARVQYLRQQLNAAELEQELLLKQEKWVSARAGRCTGGADYIAECRSF